MSDALDGDDGGDTIDDRNQDQDHDHDHDRDRESVRSGRTLVVIVFVGCVLLAGGFGFFIGSIGPRALGSIGILGVTLFRPTPIGMALYGMTVTGLALGIIYVGARFAIGREERLSSDK